MWASSSYGWGLGRAFKHLDAGAAWRPLCQKKVECRLAGRYIKFDENPLVAACRRALLFLNAQGQTKVAVKERGALFVGVINRCECWVFLTKSGIEGLRPAEFFLTSLPKRDQRVPLAGGLSG